MEIALIADGDTANFFKIGGLEHVFAVKKPENAEKILSEIIEKKKFAILLITDIIAHKNRALINEIIEDYEFPIIISIPTLGRTSHFGTDTITELIRRKLGIELK
ncbi:MAG: V-type ATP synthase subunit F [Promethearchaeota archaeon]